MISKCRFGTKLRLSVAILVITCLCLEHVKGSCLSYGHSCWGAHGKRGGPPKRTVSGDGPPTLLFRPQPSLDQTNVLSPALTAADRWALVRVLPDKNPYYPFSKMMHRPPPVAASQFFFTDDADTTESDSQSGIQETTNSGPAGRLADTSNDSKQTLSSAELSQVLGDERLFASRIRPAASMPAVQRRDHSRRKKPLSMATRNRYVTVDDSYEDNPGADNRLMAPTDEDIGQMLLLDAATAAAAAVSSDSDGAPGTFSRKLLSTNAKTVESPNA